MARYRKARRRRGYRRNAPRKTAQARSPSTGRFVRGKARKASKGKRKGHRSAMRRDARGRFVRSAAKGRRSAMRRDARGRFVRSAAKGHRSAPGRGVKGGASKGKRVWAKKGPRTKSLRRARSKIRWANRTAPGSSSRKALERFGLKSNPGAMFDAMKQVLPIAGAFYGSRFVIAKLADVGPVSDMLAKLPMGGKLTGPVLSGAVLAGVHFGTKKGALAKHRSSLMLGSAFAFIDAAFAAFAPASVASQFGVPTAAAMPMPAADYFPVSEYVSQSDYVAMSDYADTDQSPRQLHEVWGVHGMEEELGSDNYGSLQSSW